MRWACACARACVRSCVRACVRSCVRACVRACMCMHAHTQHKRAMRSDAFYVTHSKQEWATSFPPRESPFSNTPSYLDAFLRSSLPHLKSASARQVMTGSIFLGGQPLFPGAAVVISGAVLSPGQVHAVQCALAFAAVDKRLQGLAYIHTYVHTYYVLIQPTHTIYYVLAVVFASCFYVLFIFASRVRTYIYYVLVAVFASCFYVLFKFRFVRGGTQGGTLVTSLK